MANISTYIVHSLKIYNVSDLDSKALFLPINVPQPQINISAQALQGLQFEGASEVRSICS